MLNDTITTKIFREDLAALRELKKKHRLAGIADAISWILDQQEGRTPPFRACVLLEKDASGQLSVTLVDAVK